ncbi:MAG: metallophosphoesterase [Promethearchaeota archaeon]
MEKPNIPRKKRKKTLVQALLFHVRNVILIFILFAPIPTYILACMYYMDSQPLEKPPYTHFNGIDPSKEMYISWETQTPLDSRVWLGTSPDDLKLVYNDSVKVTFHRVKLIGLSAGTRYYYRVGPGQDGDSIYHGTVSSFRTAPDANSSFKIGIYSDSQQMWGTGHYKTISEIIAREEGLSFISCVGDIVQEGDQQEDWNLWFAESRPWMNDTPFVPVIGNHDYDNNNPNASYYTKYFGFSYSEGSHAGHFYYAFNWSNVQFVIGEISTTNTRDNATFVPLHDAWINQTFKNGQDKTFRILMFHRNLMTSTTSDNRLIDRVTAIAEDYNVSLVIFGHNHHYERLKYHGKRYLCLGGGGGMQDGAFRIIPECEFLNIGPSYTTIKFQNDLMYIKTFSESGDLIDSFTLLSINSNAVLPEEVP